MSAIAIMAGSVATPQISAEWFSATTTPSDLGQNFKKKWDVTTTIDVDADGEDVEVTVTVGYDTWWTNEDYVDKCYAPHGWEHKAYVINGQGVKATTKTRNGGYNTNKADVKHDGSSVTYGVMVNI